MNICFGQKQIFFCSILQIMNRSCNPVRRERLDFDDFCLVDSWCQIERLLDVYTGVLCQLAPLVQRLVDLEGTR